MKTPPRFEILVGLLITDDAQYDQYRAGMTPILESVGGYFRADFRISEVLIAPSSDPINRVFILSFPDEETKNRFFELDSYKGVRGHYFDSAVQSVTMIASFTHAQT